MDPFNIEHQYQAYLRRMSVEVNPLHPEQKRLLRQTFYGAWGQLLDCLEEDIAALSLIEAAIMRTAMKEQVTDLFLHEAAQHITRNN